jgi:ATP-dependent HslUV protease subunit HslV
MIGDGQVTMGGEIVKPNVKKVRRIGTGVIGGFAGAQRGAAASTPTLARSHLRCFA